MQVDFLEIMESLFHIHNIEMTLIRLEDLPAETSDSTDILQKLTLDFKSRQISEAILKALKPNCISILHTETMLNYVLTHNHHFKWWFDLALIRAGYMHAQKGGYRKRCYWSAYKAVLLESSFLDSSACSLIYFFIASSVILPMVET